MHQILLTEGLESIKFGFSPKKVKSICGSKLCYEDWMGGNLENFLYYKGLLVGFRGEVEEYPTENSHVCMFQVKTTHPLSIWGEEITDATKQEIEILLTTNKQEYKILSNGIVQCIDQELQFYFNDSGSLDEVYFAN